LYLLVLGVLLLYLRLSRALERRADAIASTVSAAYAGALERLCQVNLRPAVLRRAGMHPHLYDRMVAAGATPSWPRPLPPRSLLLPWLALLLLAGAPFAGSWYLRGAAWSAKDDLTSLRLRVAINGQAFDAGWLAFWHHQHHEVGTALALLGAAETMDPSESAWPAWTAMALAQEGQCDEAAEALKRARSRHPESRHTWAAQSAVESCKNAEK
jgi:hypothetical protein